MTVQRWRSFPMPDMRPFTGSRQRSNLWPIWSVNPYGLSAIILTFMSLATLLTVNLGVVNLLPIPALDGGRLVFLIIEAVRGKPVPPEKEGIVHLIGIILLMILMVFVLFNDISRFFR